MQAPVPPRPHNGHAQVGAPVSIAAPGAEDRAARRRRDYAMAALDAEVAEVAEAHPGARNVALNAAAYALGGIVGAEPGALSEAEVTARLLTAARAAGLSEPEARATIESGLWAGRAYPRDLAHVGTGARYGVGSWPRPRTAAASAPVALPPAEQRGQDSDANRARAFALWESSRPVPGTPAATYLAARALFDASPAALRHHDDVVMPDGGRHPALVAAVTVPDTGELIAVQRTALRSDGRGKAAIEPARAALGGTRGGAVVLGDVTAGEGPILEGEGIETVLSGVAATGLPGIATLSCGALGRPPLPGRRPVIILVDRGAEAAALSAAARRHAEGRAVRLAHVPDDLHSGQPGTDANDLLRQRGRDVVRAMIEVAVPYRPEPPGPAPLPAGFQRRADGWIEFAVAADAEGGGDEPLWADLCSPLEVLAATRDGDGRAWGRLIRVQDPDERWAELAMPMAWQAGDGRELRAALLGLGLRLAPGTGPRAALGRLLATCEPTARARCVARLGWHGRAYVLPEAVIGDTAGERIVWQPETTAPHACRTGGSLDGWRATVAAPVAGNSRLVLALSAAFAAPLLTPLGLEGGGFHVRGSSSLGKTTLLRVAGSMWGGGGLDGYVRRWRATANGLEGVATLHCDGLLCLDELAETDGRDAHRAAYMLANGQGKQRAGPAGEARAPQTWRVLFVSTGELTLADKLAEDGRRVTAGQEVRVIDVAADAGAGLGLFEALHGAVDADAFARRLGEASAAHYGYAARAYLDALTADLDANLGLARATMRTFEGAHLPAGATGQVRRVLARFAVVAAGGELAIRLDIVPWPQGEATRAAARCFRDWLAARGGAGDHEAERAVEQVRAFIEAHGASRFAPVAEPDRAVLNRAGFRAPGADGRPRWLVLPQVWRTEVCRGLDPEHVARALAGRGMLACDPTGYQVRRRVGGMGQLRVYELTPRLLDESGTHQSDPPVAPSDPEGP